MSEELLRLAENNPWLNLVFLALAVTSVIITIVVYFASKREQQPVFNKKSFSLIKDNLSKLDGLKITFMGTDVVTLTTTQVAIWNKGKDAINKSDVAPLDPIRIEIDEGKSILQADITHRSNEVNNFSVTLEDRRVVNINFDYFHKNEGVVVELYHTGSSNEDVKIAGTIKGVGTCKGAAIPEYYSFDRYSTSIIERIEPKNMALKYVVLVLIVLPIFLVPFFVFQSFDYIRRAFSVMPKEFEFDS